MSPDQILTFDLFTFISKGLSFSRLEPQSQTIYILCFYVGIFVKTWENQYRPTADSRFAAYLLFNCNKRFTVVHFLAVYLKHI